MAGNAKLYAFLAGSHDKSRRLLAAGDLRGGGGTPARVDVTPLDTSFAPAAAQGYPGPEWAVPVLK